MIITILGPTASGKTQLAVNLAYRLGAEIISADSRQVYKKMNIGTGKDYEDYVIKDSKIPYHLIDIVDPVYEYNVFEYQRDFLKVYNRLKIENKKIILCGGSGMYIEAVLKGYKLIKVPVNESLRKILKQKTDSELIRIIAQMKQLHNKTDTDNRKRMIRAIEIETWYSSHPEHDDFPEIKPLIFGILLPREEVRKRITKRLELRLKAGMLKEVEGLLNDGIPPEKLIYYGLEYKFLCSFITGEISYSEMFSRLNTAIHQFAKRQMTWFRKMERSGAKIHWIDGMKPVERQLEEVIHFIPPLDME